jgi:hypothetical protein
VQHAASVWKIVPAIIADMGDRTAERYLEFFAISISNKNTISVNPAQATIPTLLTVPLPDVCYLTSLGAFSWL